MGERHLGNLLAIGQTNIALWRTRGLPLRGVQEAAALPVFNELGRALAEFRPEIAVVCNPTALHLSTALAAARAGCHVLVEKPVAHSVEGIAELERALAERGRFGMVAYMMRFHPLLVRLKHWLDEGPDGTLGAPLYARASWGEHVPDWHPWEDYTESYAVRRELGGGPALTYSHDLDTMCWLLGEPALVATATVRTAALAGDTEHGVDWLLRFGGGAVAHLHADYFTRPPVRTWELNATRGRVEFDYLAGTLTRFGGIVGERPPATGAIAPAAEVHRVPEGFVRNDMFVAELKYFLDCVAAGRPPRPDIAEGGRVLRLALRALTENGGI